MPKGWLCAIIGTLASILISILSFLGAHAYEDIQTMKLAVKELQDRAIYTNGSLPAAPIKTKIAPQP